MFLQSPGASLKRSIVPFFLGKTKSGGTQYPLAFLHNNTVVFVPQVVIFRSEIILLNVPENTYYI